MITASAAPSTYVATRRNPDGGEDRGHESDSVDVETEIPYIGSPQLQPYEDGGGSDVFAGANGANGEVEEAEQDYAAQDEPYLAEDTYLDSRYRIRRILGHGNFSTTYLAEETPMEPEPPDMPPKVVAIKRIKQQFALIGENEFLLLGFLHEGEKLRHIISPIASFISETNHFHLVLEPLDSARPISLSKCRCLPRSPHSNLACPHRHLSLAKILVQLLSGLLSLHSHHLIHADLTPANVLFLPSSNRIKLIDLGNAIQPDDREAYLDDFGVQSACYRAPEILLGSGPLSRVMDVWSAGVIAVELLLDGGVIGDGLEGAELMRSCVGGREAMVLRTVELVGSVREYAGGMYYADMYDEISLEPVVFTPENGERESPRTEKKGILKDFLEHATGDVGLVDFLMDMMEVGVRRRKTVNEMLRHPWLIRQLLGSWGDVLMGEIEGDGTVGGDDVQHQLEFEAPEEEGVLSDVQGSEEVDGVPSLLFFDGRQDGENLDHTSLWEDVSVSRLSERELQSDGVKREQSTDIIQLGILPPPTEVLLPAYCDSSWQYVSLPERQLQLDEVKRECSSGLTVLRFSSDNEVDYLDDPTHSDNSVPGTSPITSGTASITFGENTLSSLPFSPLPTPPLLGEGTTSTEASELCSLLPIGFVGSAEQAGWVERVEQVERVRQVERVEQVEMEYGGEEEEEEEYIEASGVWDRDLAADMVCI